MIKNSTLDFSAAAEINAILENLQDTIFFLAHDCDFAELSILTLVGHTENPCFL